MLSGACSRGVFNHSGMRSSKLNTDRVIVPDLLVPNPKLRLREQLREVMRFKHYSVRTEETYWHWIRQFILFHGKRHPRELGDAQVHQFLTHLATQRDVAVATQNQDSMRWCFCMGRCCTGHWGNWRSLCAGNSSRS